MKCPLCPKEYQSQNDLEKHLKKIHKTTLNSVITFKNGYSISDSIKELWDNPEDDRWNNE
jgi:hypothetical protein